MAFWASWRLFVRPWVEKKLLSRRKSGQRVRLLPESLESRMLLAAVSWDGGGDGVNWHDALNWSGHAVPVSTDDVLISVEANPTIKITAAAGSISVNTLTCDEAIEISGGTLSVAGDANVTGNVTHKGGTIRGGTWKTSAGGRLVLTSSGGTLDALTANPDLDLSTTSAYATVLNGLVLNGTATLGTYAHLDFNGSQSLSGTGTVVFNGAAALRQTASAGTLTIGSGITIRGGAGSGYSGTIGFASIWGGNSDVSVINEGTINADTSGKSITISGATWTNTGSLRTAAGTAIRLEGTGTSTGTIDSTGAIVNNGPLTYASGTAAMGYLEGTGSTTVSAGLSLSAKRIRQSALTLGDNARVSMLSGGVNTDVSVLSSLTMGTAATLDLADNDLIVRTADAVARQSKLDEIKNLVQQARARNAAGKLWQGTGITTSSALPDGTGLTGLAVIANVVFDPMQMKDVPIYSTLWQGQAVDFNSILVKYTYNGDVNVDGIINFDDYFRINTGFLSNGALNGYQNGDLNFDAIINFDDYFMINSAFLGQGSTIMSPASAEPAHAAAAQPIDIFSRRMIRRQALE